MRPAHSRFYEGTPVWKEEFFDRVVTTCWEAQGNRLKYAAAVFRRDSKNAHWNKKLHRETAFKRFEETPIYVELSIGGSTNVDFSQLNSNAVDWCIATVLLPAFGGTSRFKSSYHHVSFPSYSYFNDQYTFFKDRVHDNRKTLRGDESLFVLFEKANRSACSPCSESLSCPSLSDPLLLIPIGLGLSTLISGFLYLVC